MNDWKTDLNVKPAACAIQLADPVLTIGSCFSQGIGQRLKDNKFSVLVNPFGTTYNPLSVHRLLKLALRKETLSETDFVVHQDMHYHYQFHSSFTGPSREDLSAQISHAVNQVNSFLTTASFLIITYGTAWAYKRKDTDEWVANCHKVPASHFSKTLLSVETMENSFAEIHSLVKAINPTLKIIVTVSPVRHLKETLELNAVSKASLRLLCHHLVGKWGVDYFPSYEIMMDDLRDYRFYKTDRIHPTHEAEEYIWQKFSQKYFDTETITFLNKWQGIKSALNHKSLFPATSHHQSFLESTLGKLESVQHLADVSEEILSVKNQIRVR